MLDRLTNALGFTSSRRSEYETIASPVVGHSRRSTLSEGPMHTRQRSLSVHSVRNQADPRIKWAHLVLGAASLLSWNAMITATPYYSSRLQGSALQSTFASYVTSTFTVAGFLALGHVTMNATKVHASARIRPSILVLIGCMVTLNLSTFIPTSPNVFFAFILVNAIVQSSFGAFFQSAVVALASLFGPYAVQATFAGQAAVGVFVSLTQYVTAAVALSAKRRPASPESVEPGDAEDTRKSAAFSAFMFFTVSIVFLLFTLAVHTWLVRLPAYVEIVKPLKEDEDLEETTSEEEEDIIGEDHPMVSSVRSLREDGQLLPVRVESITKVDELNVWHIAKLNGVYNFAVSNVFIVTLAVFPPITASIQSTHHSWAPILFNAFHFLVFNVGDYTGRALCSYPFFLVWSRRRLLALSLSRIAFIPIFLACNIQRPQPANLPPGDSLPTATINSDFIYLCVLLLFGITNGHTSTLCMMAASSPEHNKRLKKEQVQAAATIAQFCLVGGLAIGSFASFAVRGAICDCNPFRG